MAEYKEYLLYSTLLTDEKENKKELSKSKKDEIIKASKDFEDDEIEAISMLIYEHYRRVDGKDFNYDDVLDDIKYIQEKKNSKIDFDSLEPELQHVIYRFLFSSSS